jgi:hypothetical protein
MKSRAVMPSSQEANKTATFTLSFGGVKFRLTPRCSGRSNNNDDKDDHVGRNAIMSVNNGSAPPTMGPHNDHDRPPPIRCVRWPGNQRGRRRGHRAKAARGSPCARPRGRIVDAPNQLQWHGAGNAHGKLPPQEAPALVLWGGRSSMGQQGGLPRPIRSWCWTPRVSCACVFYFDPH